MLRTINGEFLNCGLNDTVKNFHKYAYEANKKYDDPYSGIRDSIAPRYDSTNVFDKPFYGYPSEAINEYYRNGGK